jgi:hypothetical protein|tara:strand:+ start:223 stop:1080 length:858 start_codon:yes stop_codon:yes gene_type:complete
MNHLAELKLHQYMTDAVKGKSTISDEVINQVADDVRDSLQRQFGGKVKRKDFRLRMSNIGRPTCQLWYEKNKPEAALPRSSNFMMNMMLGDIVEAVFKGLLRGAKVDYEDSDDVVLKLKDSEVSGSYDLVIDGAVDDVKSASDWSYKNKFDSYDTLSKGDGFGYVGQLAGYAKASGKKVGGWWVVNKANGHFKYVPASGLDLDKEIAKIEATVATVNTNKFERCFEPEIETFRGKTTGNTVLNSNCRFCDYRYDCWNLTDMPAAMSKAKMPKTVSYIELANNATS